jgi:hypothetical protein
MEEERNIHYEKTNENTEENTKKPRRPDYKGKKVAVWINENDKNKWATIKIDGIDEKFVAFENH